MTQSVKQSHLLAGSMVAAGVLLLSAGLTSSCGEEIDNFNSEITCSDYCDKKADCNNSDPSNNEIDACIDSCRNSIEDDCGNEHQAAANDQIGECVDKGCTDFWACMIFDAAPECYGFVN